MSELLCAIGAVVGSVSPAGIADNLMRKALLVDIQGTALPISLSIAPAVPVAPALVAAGLARVIKTGTVACHDVILVKGIKVGLGFNGAELAHGIFMC